MNSTRTSIETSYGLLDLYSLQRLQIFLLYLVQSQNTVNQRKFCLDSNNQALY
jgi:hypothetical protein